MEKQIITIETLQLAKEKGFKPKTVSTSWTFKSLLGEGKLAIGALVNLQCQSNLLSEIQKWLRDEHKIDIQILRNKPGYDEYFVEIYKTDDSSKYDFLILKEDDGVYIKWFPKYEEAQEQALYKALMLIENEKLV